ncbi:hypothetical protein GQ53DRAFT_727990 [Thozetella sp. PMI_491]|nr:hypothetical protein GQ53DRAFT_727990 [Thozetella sp. PMI_491]
MPPHQTPSPQQRGMRKGTHSCYECRKRKVRCIFARGSTICESCSAKGQRCTEQSRRLLQAAGLENRESLRARIARLEATIQASSSHDGIETTDQAPRGMEIHPLQLNQDVLEANSTSPLLVHRPTPTPTLPVNTPTSSDNDSPQSIDPIVTLFDNAIWKRRSSDRPETPRISQVEGPAATTRHVRTRESLLLNFISTELLEPTIIATCSWWHTWRPLGPWLPALIGDQNTTTLPDFVLWALDSSDPSIVGLAMLCVAVSLQQLDTRIHQYIIRRLPRPPGVLFQEYLEKVERFIIFDSDYAGTKEGVQAITFMAKIYMNLGLHKKSWVFIHQAISYAQILGFHRPEPLSASETKEERHCRIQSWLALCTVDLYTSLLLGLPYAADARTIPSTQSQENRTALLQHNLMLLSADVIDRNQRGFSLSPSRTEEIQRRLNKATEDLDETFWNSSAALESGTINHPEYLEKISTQCWLYHILVLLHMPLMIHSVEDVQLEKHRTACLNASRNFLKVYHIMRSDAFSAFSMVKLIDYQAFICSSLLILGLLGYGSSARQAETKDEDRDLIRSTIATLRQASGTVNNPIASQAVQGLETLVSLDVDCPQKRPSPCPNPYAKIVVPYVGIITISPGGYYTNARPGFPSSETPPPLAFALFHDAAQSTSHPVASLHPMPSNSGIDGEQHDEIEASENIHTELGSLDFDWSSATAPNFEGDWAWLNYLSK